MELYRLSERVVRRLAAAGLRLGLAESCTGGRLSGYLTDVPGASEVLDVSVVAYSNSAKKAFLGVSEGILQTHGAVSGQTALAMARGLLDRRPVDLSLAVTGIAGPGGGSELKPVGLVFIALVARRGETRVQRLQLEGDRAAIRDETCRQALLMLLGGDR